MSDEPRDDAQSGDGLWGDVFKEARTPASGQPGVRDRPEQAKQEEEAPPVRREQEVRRAAPQQRAEPRRAAPAAEPAVVEPSRPPPPPRREPVAPRPPPARPQQPGAPARPPRWAELKTPPPRKRRFGPPLVPVLVALALVAAVAGFLLGNSGEEEANPSQGQVSAGERAEQRALRSYDSRLESVISVLSRRAVRGRARLRSARTARRQGRVADDLAGAYSAAGRSLRAGSAPPARADADVSIRSALSAVSRAYRRLGRAARRGSRRAYGAARGTVERREQALRRALANPGAAS